MSKLKTNPNEGNVEAFLEAVPEERKRTDSRVLLELMQQLTGEEPRMWGSSIVGFGQYHYRYASGREGDWFKVGFAPRKNYLSVYLNCSSPRLEELREQLGKHKSGKACLNIKKLEDVDLEVLEKLVNESIRHIDRQYPPDTA